MPLGHTFHDTRPARLLSWGRTYGRPMYAVRLSVVRLFARLFVTAPKTRRNKSPLTLTDPRDRDAVAQRLLNIPYRMIW